MDRKKNQRRGGKLCSSSFLFSPPPPAEGGTDGGGCYEKSRRTTSLRHRADRVLKALFRKSEIIFGVLARRAFSSLIAFGLPM